MIMGEQPVFTTKAHVFKIDPETRKQWLPVSKQAVGVSFFFDNTRRTHRIISVDGSKAIINSTITPNMTYTKTSQKFVQWADIRANTVYGLGFSEEAELSKFLAKFQEAKESARHEVEKIRARSNPGTPVSSRRSSQQGEKANGISPGQQGSAKERPGQSGSPGTPKEMRRANGKQPSNGTPANSGESPAGSGRSSQEEEEFIDKFQDAKQSARQEVERIRAQSGGSTPQTPHTPQKTPTVNGTATSQGSAGTFPRDHRSSQSLNLPPENTESFLDRTDGKGDNGPLTADSQLKYENDRLKIALGQSSANAKKWEVELQTLKNNNTRLTTALQESTANVEEWKKQLAAYKDDNDSMKKKLLEMEGAGGRDQLDVVLKEKAQLAEEVERLKIAGQNKDKELERLREEMEALKHNDTRNQGIQQRLNASEQDKRDLQQRVSTLEGQLDTVLCDHRRDAQRVQDLEQQIGDRLRELTILHEQLVKVTAIDRGEETEFDA